MKYTIKLPSGIKVFEKTFEEMRSDYIIGKKARLDCYERRREHFPD